MSKVILLSRVSTGHQDLEQQTQELIKYAKGIGYQEEDFIVIEDKESAVKLSEEERQGLNKMKESIATYPVKDVVIYELSRLSRVPKILYSVRDFLVEHNVQLHILNPHIKLLKQDGTIDESANVIFSLFCSLAENEGYVRKQRMARGKAKAKSENRYTGGALIFGYCSDNKHNYIIKEDEGDIVRRIFHDYLTKTVVDIAKDLVFEGLVKTNVNSTAALVRNILHRKLYYGEEYKGIKYPPIISKQDYDDVANKIHERKKYSKTKSKHSYLCRGIVTDINNEPLKPLYCHQSYTHFNIGKYNWESLSINMPFLDDVALYYALENKKRKPGKDLMKYKLELQEELKSITKKVSTIDKKLSENNDKIMKLEMRYASGKMSEEVLDLLVGKVKEEIHKLDRDRGDLEAEGEDLKKRLNNLSKSGRSPLLGRISELSEEDKVKAVHEEIEKIIIIKGKKRYDYVLGIQFFGGNYVMVDANARYKRIWDESGVEVAYKNLLTSQQGGNKNKHYTINNGN